MQENRSGELEEARQESFSFQKRIIVNWKLIKKSLRAVEIIDSFISEELVDADIWDYMKNESRRSQMDSILSNVLKHINTSDDYAKFEKAMTTHNIELQIPSVELNIPGHRRTEDHLRANKKWIEKELYPKDLIDSYLEWFILSPEDHEGLRSKENVRQHMAHSFLEKIMKPPSIEKGSMSRLLESFQRDQNCILMHLSKLMDSVLQNGISHIIDDKDLIALTKMREDCRNSLLCEWIYLNENLYPYSILIDELHNAGLVDEDRADIIREKPRREQVYQTLRNIIRRIDGPEMLSKLVSILKKENSFIADKLGKTSNQKAVTRAKQYDFRQLSGTDVNDAQAKLEYYKDDIVKELYQTDVDTFVESLVFNVDDHEIICEAGNGENGKALCFYEKISDKEYIMRGSLDCLVFCLRNNERLKKSRQKLAELLLSRQMPKQVKNRTKITVTASGGVLYRDNTSIFTRGELELTVDDVESKGTLEDEIFEVVNSFEHKEKEIDGLKLKATKTKRSSVIVQLKSNGENVKFVVENGIVNGDLTSFVRNLLEDENIKMHMSLEKKYNLSVILRSNDQQRGLPTVPFSLKDLGIAKTRTIKANRELLEEEYDPMPFLKAVFEENVKKYKSVENLFPKYGAVFKKQLSDIIKLPERRKRVEQFLNIAENTIDAETLWELIEETANAFTVKKMRDDLNGLNPEQENIRFSGASSEKGRVFDGKYEVWITKEDIKSPLQSICVEERTKREKDLNEQVEFWKKIRRVTLPRLDELNVELRNANEKIRLARQARNLTVGATLLTGFIFSLFTAGVSMAAAVGAAAVTGGAAGITLLIETYVEKDVLKKSQEDINKDKEATLRLITRVRAYRGTESMPFAENLYSVRLDRIEDLARDPLTTFISSLVDTQSASLMRAIERLTEFRQQLEKELQEVERVQGLHSFK